MTQPDTTQLSERLEAAAVTAEEIPEYSSCSPALLREAAFRLTQLEGTPASRFEWLIEELLKRFPDSLRESISAQGPEQRVLDKLDSSLSKIAIKADTTRLTALAMNLCEYHKHDRKGFEDDCGFCIDALKKLEEAYALGSSADPRCDCGAKLTQCTDCAIGEYQGAHPDCPQCCVTPEPMTDDERRIIEWQKGPTHD